jgi:S1-C subfamily serine protease
MVDKVVDGTLADKIGLRKGDIVTRVGKKRINEVGDVADALDELKDGKVVVTVIRRGREVRLN